MRKVFVDVGMSLDYVDALFPLGCFCALVVPLVFLTRRNHPGTAAAGH